MKQCLCVCMWCKRSTIDIVLDLGIFFDPIAIDYYICSRLVSILSRDFQSSSWCGLCRLESTVNVSRKRQLAMSCCRWPRPMYPCRVVASLVVVIASMKNNLHFNSCQTTLWNLHKVIVWWYCVGVGWVLVIMCCCWPRAIWLRTWADSPIVADRSTMLSIHTHYTIIVVAGYNKIMSHRCVIEATY